MVSIVIGIIARNEDRDIAKEFFELLKISWEVYEDGRKYDAVLCNGVVPHEPNAPLTVMYGALEDSVESYREMDGLLRNWRVEMDWKGNSFPVYHNACEQPPRSEMFLAGEKPNDSTVVILVENGCNVARIGYDLFGEVGEILCKGQPAEYAAIPTLELHAAILRNLMVEAGVPFAEVPAVPDGFDFSACLTHDIDFSGIKDHVCDHTMFGFLYRALLKTALDALRGKNGWEKVRKNLSAALSLPAVYLGLAKDFWDQFERYRKIETGLKSTFFFLPYKGVAGKAAPGRRACKYDIRDLQRTVSQLVSAGCEIGLHGINAWHDWQKGKMEADRIASVTGKPIQGTRMHWLYFDEHSPEMLEKAGLTYDSTFGYNDAIGFRAGTAQVFKPLGAQRILELPLTIQDTAMFYSDRMNLKEDRALILCRDIIEKISTFGGVLVVNWHDRSLAPERLWGDFYERLLNEIKSHRVWFATGSEVTDWFRKRRAVRFTEVEDEDGTRRLKIGGVEKGEGPDLTLRLYGDWDAGAEAKDSGKGYREMPLREDMELKVPPLGKERLFRQD